MKTQMFKILSGAALAMVALSGCNTTEGLGEDISKAGTAISGAAHDTGNKISGKTDEKTAETHTTVQHHTAHKKAAHKRHKKAAKTVAVVKKADGENKETTTTTTETKTETKADKK